MINTAKIGIIILLPCVLSVPYLFTMKLDSKAMHPYATKPKKEATNNQDAYLAMNTKYLLYVHDVCFIEIVK
jgi:hypothetical protein